MRSARIAAALMAAFTILTAAIPATAQGNRRRPPASEQFDRAYQIGYRDGAQDARQGRAFEFDREKQLRKGGREFRNGYADGYRAGFESYRPAPRSRSVVPLPNLQNRSRVYSGGRGGAYQDPARARGLSEGYRRGFEDGRDRDRYDPVRHGEYRHGDNGYFGGYGSKDAYKNNYRDGFRQGYEDGYRDGTRGGRS
jgi:hypothetical protein